MVFGPWQDVWQWARKITPNILRPGKIHFNFLAVHYIYMIGLTIVGSILLYPAGGMRYIDALFFAAGSATQSGLNTLNVNDINTYQQIVLYLIACVGNPIWINSSVVMLRLYWFEKRFKNIVREAKISRRSRTRSRTGSESRPDPDPGRLEMGVNGRKITVLHDTTIPNGMSPSIANGAITNSKEKDAVNQLFNQIQGSSPNDSSQSESAESSNTVDTQAPNHIGLPPALKRDITFADELGPPSQRKEAINDDDDDDNDKREERRSTEHHIAFLNKQRNTEQGTLRIPGPRDFDRGVVPRELDSDEEERVLAAVVTGDSGTTHEEAVVRRQSDSSSEHVEMNMDDQPPRRGIAFDEPEKPITDRQPKAKPHKPRFNPLRPLDSVRHRGEFNSSLSSIRARTRTFSFTKSQERDMPDATPYLSWQPTIGRNSAFLTLTEAQREELGGIEYRSLKTLGLVLGCYFFGFHLLGVIVYVPWIIRSGTWGPIVDADGVSRAWWGIFTPASSFNDLGFTLTPDSMESFQTAVMPMLFGAFLIIIGNTGFPCMLRFVIWVTSVVVPRGSGLYEELRFLLDHPRRCFTLLFPSRATWWLFWILVLLNAIDLIFFIILDLNDPVVTVLSGGFRFLDGLFQAASTRTAGFAVVNIAGLHPAIQVSYLIMMYISVFPIAISVRRTNVYEEKSLGIWGGEEEDDGEGKSYVGQHLRRQLSFDLWYIFLGLFIIAIVEGSRLQDTNDYAFTMFAVLFEIVSAYGTVGLSLGYPNIDPSFSTEFRTLSKLVIVAMMLRGRHRGLPYALDRAILLPSEKLHRKEAEEAARRSTRRSSGHSTIPEPQSAAALSLDEQGLPRQNTGAEDEGTANNMGVGRRLTQRRGSEVSTRSRAGAGPGAGGQRRLSNFIAGTLSAGPTWKRD